jgi:two-component system, cell cycle response regulator
MEVARQFAEAPGESLLLCVDSTTAANVGDLDRLRSAASKTMVLDTGSHGIRDDGKGMSRRSAHNHRADDRVFILLSSSISVAMLGQAVESETRFTGGWTADRESTAGIAQMLLAGGEGMPIDLPAPEPDAVLRWTPQVTRMMTIYTRLVSSHQTTGTVERDDLISVLDILKAISSRRRSHDVLFVFVEQIARVIQVDRCSVVRIWATEDNGQVVASHDDAGVRDLVIELGKYPELRRSMEMFEKVVIDDAQTHPLTRECGGLKSAGIRGILVIPIVLLDANVGSLFLRAVRKDNPFTQREAGFCEIVAEAASNALERAHLLERLQIANEHLERLAVTDELTGLHNHRYFRERFAEEFDRARRYGLPLSCIIFDIDDFKKINDEYGHLQGDDILREIAARTHRTTRRSDIVARYGGEEFIIIMPQTAVEGAMSQAERVRECIGKGGYSGMKDGAIITVSLGVSELNHRVMLDGESLIRAADSALYEAKRSGKNCVVAAASTEN